MELQLLIINQDTGIHWNCTNSVTTVNYTTNRTGSPGTLQFTILKSESLTFQEGDVVRFSADGTVVFYGWVFSKSKDRWGVIEVTCYDMLRYLKANNSYYFEGLTAGEIIAQIAADYQLPLSVIEDTGYAIPSLSEEEQCCLDIIGSAVEETLLNTGKVYVFYTDEKGLCLQEAQNMKSNIVLGDHSLVTEYTYKTDIDQQTYNCIKLTMPNEQTGKTDVHIAYDSYHIGRWGILQLYQSVDGDKNQAQMVEQAAAMLQRYNRKTRTLSLTALGIVGLRAGQMIYTQIKELGDIEMAQYLLVEKASHTFENGTHTMDLELYTM